MKLTKSKKQKLAALALIDARLVASKIFSPPDRFGHYKTDDGEFRIKVQATSIRFERMLTGTWCNVKSSYFSAVDDAFVERIAVLAVGFKNRN